MQLAGTCSTPVTINNAQEFNVNQVFEARGEWPGLRLAIEFAVIKVFGVAKPILYASTRCEASAAHARQVAMYLAHVGCGLTFTDVGRLFGRDRTTVTHACSVIEDKRDDRTFDDTLNLLEIFVGRLLRREIAHRQLS